MLAISSRREEGIGFDNCQHYGIYTGRLNDIQLDEATGKERLNPLLYRKLGKRYATQLE